MVDQDRKHRSKEQAYECYRNGILNEGRDNPDSNFQSTENHVSTE